MVLGAVLIACAAAVLVLKWRFNPWLRERAVAMLSDRFESEVEIRDFNASLLPPGVDGGGLVLRFHGRKDVPPLITIQKFHADASLLGLWRWHIRQVKVAGMQIQVPPRDKKPEDTKPKGRTREIRVSVGEFISDNTELVIIPKNPEKDPHVYEIHRLIMHNLGLGRSASFKTSLTNATPPGEIETVGHFGPWNRDDPAATPVDATYIFSNADLGVFKGISGILSSTGKFAGPLNQLAVEGQTNTPDFTVDVGGHPVRLTTQYDATVDGSNGDTLLHPVIADFLHTRLICNGGIVKPKSGHGKEISLQVMANDARLEDLMALAVKGKPPMTGSVDLNTKFDLPPGKGEIVDRLALDGQFGIEQGNFTELKLQDKIKALSRRGQGKPDEEDAGSAVTELKGHFALKNGTLTFRDLTFAVTGAAVELSGTYALRSGEMDFRGHLRLTAKLSQTMTGVKSWLLKPFDAIFRKNGKTVVPIKITGTRDHPSFGLNL
jgi:hypothetical protein